MTALMIDDQMLPPPTDVRDFLLWNTEFYLQHENDRIEWFILLTEHSSCVRKLHGNFNTKEESILRKCT